MLRFSGVGRFGPPAAMVLQNAGMPPVLALSVLVSLVVAPAAFAADAPVGAARALTTTANGAISVFAAEVDADGDPGGATASKGTAGIYLEIGLIDQQFVRNAVPGYTLILTRQGRPAATGTRIVTRPDGTVATVVPAGHYSLRSEFPLEFEGQAFEWSISVQLIKGDHKHLRLSRANATLLPARSPWLSSVLGHTYTNDDLGFSYTFPEGWIVMGRETQQHLEARSRLRANSALLRLSRYPVGQPRNSNIQVVAEDLSGFDPTPSALEYIAATTARLLLETAADGVTVAIDGDAVSLPVTGGGFVRTRSANWNPT